MTLSPLFLRHCTWLCSLYRFTKFGRMAFRCLLLLEAAWCAKWTATRSFFGHTSGSAVWKGDSQFGPFGKVFFAQSRGWCFSIAGSDLRGPEFSVVFSRPTGFYLRAVWNRAGWNRGGSRAWSVHLVFQTWCSRSGGAKGRPSSGCSWCILQLPSHFFT